MNIKVDSINLHSAKSAESGQYETTQMFHNKVRHLSRVKKLEQFRVLWKDITYTVSQKAFGRKDRNILNGVSGFFDSRQITGIMGPSGCGKSSLLGIISGQKKRNLSGSITISTNIKVKFAFIVQENHILKRLKILESILYASKLKNGFSADHLSIVEEIMHKLRIQECADILPDKCSGGQLKRIMIGLELVSKPNILILDEPTSGLDSVTALHLLHTLIELTKQDEPVAIVLTIHQPSTRMFNMLNSLYLLSYEGECIYAGSPKTMLAFFSEYGLHCPKFTNPADYALDVASSEEGKAHLLNLSTIMKINALNWTEFDFQIKVKHQYNAVRSIWYLTLRSMKVMIMDPYNLILRLFGYIVCGLLISLLYGIDSGVLGGCRSEWAVLVEEKGDALAKLNDIGADIIENTACLCFSSIFGWFCGIFPVLLIFPVELNVFLKEYGNGYYSKFSYFMSKVLSDIPFTLLLPNLGSIAIYYLTGQYSEQFYRVVNFAMIFILITMNSSAAGFLIGCALADHPTAIAFIGMLSLIPLLLLSGFLMELSSMPYYLQWLSYGSYLRFGLTSIIINTYGFGRCAQQSSKNLNFYEMVSEEQLFRIYNCDKLNAKELISAIDYVSGNDDSATQSAVIKNFHFTDHDYYFSITMLVLHLVIYRLLAYYFMVRKVNSSN